jgi:hypothetical protein
VKAEFILTSSCFIMDLAGIRDYDNRRNSKENNSAGTVHFCPTFQVPDGNVNFSSCAYLRRLTDFDDQLIMQRVSKHFISDCLFMNIRRTH